MNEICEAYDLRIKNETVKGTCNWMHDIYTTYQYLQLDAGYL